MEGKEYKLVEICDLITCGVAKRPEYFESGIPFLSSKNVKKNKIFFKDYNFISQEMHNELTKKNKPLRGDILYTRVGSFGEAAVIDFDEEFSVFVSLTLIKPKKKIVDAYYLMQFLNSEIVQALAKKSTIGNGVQNLNVNSVREFKIILPSLPDQIQIANILSKAETLIEQRKQSIALLDEFLKSTYSEMFGQMNEKNFPLERLDDVATKINDGEHGSVTKTETGVLYLMARNINRINEIDLKEISFVSREAHNKMFKRCNPEKGDILIVCVGATIGKVVIVPEMEQFSIARSVALVKPDYKKVNSKYLLWYFNSTLAKRQIKSSSLTAAQAGLYIGKIKEIKIPLPPIELQFQFASIVTKTEALKEEYKNSLQELEKLYGSLSQRAFKGELKMDEEEENILMASEPMSEYQRRK